MDVTFATQTLGTAGTVASTLAARAACGAPRTMRHDREEPHRDATRSTSGPSRASRTSFTKYVGVDTALDPQTPEASARGRVPAAAATRGWAALFGDHVEAWADLWKSDITVGSQPDLQDWIRANLYDLLVQHPRGRRRQHLPGWPEQRQLRRPDLLGRRDVDVSEPAADAPGHRRIGHRVPPQDAPGRAEQREPSYGYQGPFFPGTAPARATSTRSATAWTRRTASRRSTSRATSHLPTWQYYLATGDKAWLSEPLADPRGIAQFWATRDRRTATAPTRSRTSPARTNTPTASTTACSPTPARPPRSETQPRPPRSSGKRRRRAGTTIADHLRMPFDATNQVFLQYDGYRAR